MGAYVYMYVYTIYIYMFLLLYGQRLISVWILESLTVKPQSHGQEAHETARQRGDENLHLSFGRKLTWEAWCWGRLRIRDERHCGKHSVQSAEVRKKKWQPTEITGISRDCEQRPITRILTLGSDLITYFHKTMDKIPNISLAIKTWS